MVDVQVIGPEVERSAEVLTPEALQFVGQLQHLTLPAVSLAVGWSAWIAQVTRTAIRETAGPHIMP